MRKLCVQGMACMSLVGFNIYFCGRRKPTRKYPKTRNEDQNSGSNMASFWVFRLDFRVAEDNLVGYFMSLGFFCCNLEVLRVCRPR